MARNRNHYRAGARGRGCSHSGSQKTVALHTLHGGAGPSGRWAHRSGRTNKQRVVPGLHSVHGRHVGDFDCTFRQEQKARMSTPVRALILLVTG